MKTAVITGVTGGMGKATAERLLAEGCRVFGLDISEHCDVPVTEYIRTDLTDEDSVTAAFEKVRASADTVDCIINMAGIYDFDSLVEISEERFIRIFNVNLFACYRVNKAFLPILADNGRVVIVSSELAPLVPLPFTGLYAVTKAAAEKYASSLRMELQLIGRRVIVIRPGAVSTSLLGMSQERLDSFVSNTKLYNCNAERFRDITGRVEARNIPPEKIAELAYRALCAKRPRHVYNINRNPLLMLLNVLPERAQCFIIKKILKRKDL